MWRLWEWWIHLQVAEWSTLQQTGWTGGGFVSLSFTRGRQNRQPCAAVGRRRREKNKAFPWVLPLGEPGRKTALWHHGQGAWWQLQTFPKALTILSPSATAYLPHPSVVPPYRTTTDPGCYLSGWEDLPSFTWAGVGSLLQVAQRFCKCRCFCSAAGTCTWLPSCNNLAFGSVFPQLLHREGHAYRFYRVLWHLRKTVCHGA